VATRTWIRSRASPRTATATDLLEERLRSAGDLKLVPYIMAGHPDRDRCIEIGRRLASSGAAAIELGIPYSDPLADGPVIQRAGQRALEAGATVGGCLEIAAAIAGEGALPAVLMTYVNPILAYGANRFAGEAAESGVAGVIIPDLPVDESDSIARLFRAAGLSTVFMVAPTSSEERLAASCRASSGFVYCVTITGITGARGVLPAGLPELFSRVRTHTNLPIAAGFGISKPEHLTELRGKVDAAVVGSAIVAEIDAGRDPLPLVTSLLAASR
jgi:tryptophan synthase alpha chain